MMNAYNLFLLLVCLLGLSPNVYAQPGDMFEPQVYIFRFTNVGRGIKTTVESTADHPHRAPAQWKITHTHTHKGWEIEIVQKNRSFTENVFVFTKKSTGEVMRIHAEHGLLDIPFRAGEYRIPPAYHFLFIMEEASNQLINRDISDFEINRDAPSGISATPVLPHYLIDVRAVPGASAILAASDTSLFLVNTKKQKPRPLPFRINKDLRHIIAVAPASRQRFFVLLQDRQTKGRVVFRSDNGGNTWQQDIPLSGMQIEEVRFFSSQLGYALGHFNEEYTAFFRTTDGGDTWQLAYKIKGKNYAIKALPQEEEVIIYTLAAGGKYLYYRSTNSGESWQEFSVHPIDSNDFLGDLSLANSGLYRAGTPLVHFVCRESRRAVLARQSDGAELLSMDLPYAHYNRSEQQLMALLHSEGGNAWRYIPLSLPRPLGRDKVPYHHIQNYDRLIPGEEGCWYLFHDYYLYCIKI